MMSISGHAGEAPRTNVFMGWLRSIAAKFARSNGMEGLDRKEFEQVARDLNLSTAELDALSRKSNSFSDLLGKRLAEFGLSEDQVRSSHPEVLRDLQRVCGNCVSTSQCASEFKQPKSAANQSDYCPNTQTLQALEKEDLQTRAQAALPIGPCCC
jgi:hypothetical protein